MCNAICYSPYDCKNLAACVAKIVIAASSLVVIFSTLSLVGNYAPYPHLAMFSPSQSFFGTVTGVITFAIAMSLHCCLKKGIDENETIDWHGKIDRTLEKFKARPFKKINLTPPHSNRNFHYALATYTDRVREHGNASQKKQWRSVLENYHKKRVQIPNQLDAKLNCSSHLSRLETKPHKNPKIEKLSHEESDIRDLITAYSEEYQTDFETARDEIHSFHHDVALVARDRSSERVIGGLFIKDLSQSHARGTFMIHSVCKRCYAVKSGMVPAIKAYLLKHGTQVLGREIETLYLSVRKSDKIAIQIAEKLGFYETEGGNADFHLMVLKRGTIED